MMNAHEGHRTPDRSRSLSQVSENSVESDISTDANFYPAVLGLATFGVFNLLVTSIGILPLSLVGVIALCSSAFALQFFLLHGHHFCRAVHVFYDEANILETNEGFECYEGPIIDDSTPGGCCGPFPIMGPQDSFYVQHYGNMMPNALRFQKEWQEADRKRMEEKQKKSEVEQKSAGDNKNSQREQLSEKKSQTGKILEMRSEEAKKPEKIVMKLPDLVLMEEAVKANDYQKFKELALGKKQQGLYGAKDVNIADTCIRKRVIEFTVDGCKPEQLDGLLTFARQAIKDDLCSKTLVCALVLDALELTHIQECEPLFDVFVKHEAIWKHEPFYTTLKAMMLRVCNSINKRLSAHDDAQLSGKILQFLARRLNLCEPSGLNKPGAINNEYITTWQEFSEETAEADGEDVKEPESMETDDLEQGEIKEEEGPSLPPSQSEEPAPVALDRKLYAKFWRLQNFFASPNDIFATDKFNEFNDCLEAVFEAFRSHRVQKRRKRRRVVKPQNGPTDTEQESFYEVDDILNGLDDICAIEPGSSFDAKRDDMFCCRFFTDFEFFEQQMCDLKIRRCFLVQCLILFQYLQSDSKSKDKSLKLSAEQSLTIVEAIKTCYDLLAEVGTGNVTRSARFAKSVKNVLDREIYWNKWKFEGANAYTLNPSVDDIPMPEWKRRPRQKFSFSEVDLGNATMTRIWSNSGTLLDECAKRKFYPVAKEFLTDPLEELDPEAQIEDQYLSLNKDLIQFRMSRFLARQSSAYYTCNTNNQLADSLKGYLKKAIVSGAKLVPELQADAAAIGEKLGKIEEAEKQRLEKERAAARKRLEEEKAQKVKLEEQRKAKLAEEKKVHKAKTEKTPHRAVEVTKTPDRASKTVRTPSSDKLNKDSPKVAKTPTRSEKSDRLSEKTPLKTPEKNARMSDSKSPPKKRAREESPGRSDSPVPIDEGALSPVDVATPVSSDD